LAGVNGSVTAYDTLDLVFPSQAQDDKPADAKITQIAEAAFQTEKSTNANLLDGFGFYGSKGDGSANYRVGCIKYLRLPTTLTSIGTSVFRGNYSIETLYIPDLQNESDYINVFGLHSTNPAFSTMQKVSSIRFPSNYPVITGSYVGVLMNNFMHELKNITIVGPQNYRLINTYNSNNLLIGQTLVPKTAITNDYVTAAY
jgi:hypothetical protein